MGIKPLSACLFVVLLAACSTPKMARVSDTMALKDYTPPRVQVKTVQETVDSQAGLRAQEHGTPLSLAVRDSDLTDVLFLLSKDSNLPIVADKDVHGKVTVNISNKGIFEILDAVLKPLGYTAYVDDGFIRVSSPRLVSRTFHINYVRGSRNSSSSMNASISASTQSSGQQGTGQSVVSGGAGTGSGTGTTGTGTGSSGVNIMTDDKSNFWSELTKGLEVLVFGTTGTGGSKGDKTGKKLVLNEQSGIIYVTDYSDNMKSIETFLEDMQNTVRRQVMIQAHIIEVALKDDYSLGLDWDAIAKYNGGSVKFSQQLVPATPTNVFNIFLTGNRFNATLDAMKEQGTLNVLSSPRISAINNQKALIKLTTRQVSWIKTTYVIPGSTGNLTQTSNTPEIDEVGIFLDVTPQIDDEGLITMHIHPSISAVTSISESPDLQSSMPIIDIREVDTIVNAKTGQTVVIAGLIEDRISETKKHVPVLGEIPLLGSLFSQVSQEKTKTELVILLTPYIMNEPYTTAMSRESEERLLKMGRKFQPVPQLPQQQ